MRMNWKTTQATDEKYVYLTVMRDIKQYCASGYCEVVLMRRFQYSSNTSRP